MSQKVPSISAYLAVGLETDAPGFAHECRHLNSGACMYSAPGWVIFRMNIDIRVEQGG